MSSSYRCDVDTQRSEDLSKDHNDFGVACKSAVEASRGSLGAVKGNRLAWEVEMGAAEVSSFSYPPRRGPPLLARSPRGQALQRKQKSVVNTVPNPKWLLPSCNPIKV